MSTSLAKLASTLVRFYYLAVLLLFRLPRAHAEEDFALALNGLRRVLRLPCDLKGVADFQNEAIDRVPYKSVTNL